MKRRPASSKFPEKVLAAIRDSRIIGIRAGTKHPFIGIWMVLVGRRLFARSWSDTPEGWYRTFLEDPRGAISIDGRAIPVRAVRTRSERLKDAVGEAYGEKYRTQADRKYVRGLKLRKCRDATIELVPR